MERAKSRPGAPPWVNGVFLALAGWLVGYELHVTVARDVPTGPLFARGSSDVVLIVASLLCLWRARACGRERGAWTLVGAGLLMWSLGDLYYDVVLWDRDPVPIPSAADAGYLAFIPLLFGGLALMVRERLAHAGSTLWVDGLTAALSAGALGAAVVLEAVLDTVGGRPVSVATNLAYPVGDVILLGLIVGAVGLNSWRVTRAWALLAAGLLSFVVADGVYLVTTAQGTYGTDSPWDVGWWAGIVLVAYAAWAPPARDDTARASRAGLRMILLPLAFAAIGLALLVYASFAGVNAVAVMLAGASMLAVLVRLAMSFRENLRMLAESRREAITDSLTGLGNRRKLVADLEHEFDQLDAGHPMVLVLFDLDGFKRYNDSFGHMAGDTLLTRLGRNLNAAVQPYGRAYRMGGDEFCALLRDQPPGADRIVAGAAAALSDRGEGFKVGCSYGVVLLPREARTPTEALRLADERMYGHKDSRRASARQQTRDVLLEVLRERQPELHDHLHDVGVLARAVGRRLGMSPEELDETTRAAELHDVGKAAIPDAILLKPGPLDSEEWTFMRRHTIIGERILSAAPALVPVARLVRSSHERWDGEGYPDALAGEEIPLGARVVAVCDAFAAITSDRPYNAAAQVDQAIAELRRNAGTQFDPRVVDAFCEEVETGTAAGLALSRGETLRSAAGES